ncbi:BURP domain protein [Medicago truncatula]|uniref:BURP domain protein n=1 Tax=Medicago truncatula TaxID=3880 RepID=A0A072UL19_MEDTR|nr:BURP domain protein [Medicago truncatula]
MTHNHESNGPYITQYGKHETKQQNYITGYRTHNHESNGPYITQYGKHETKQLNYITGYMTHNHESNGPYITQYGKHETKQPNYISGYKYVIDPKGLPSTNSVEDLPIPNLDHTEAFKTGYFSFDDLHVGNVMTLQFPVQEVSPYLSKKEADSIPFSMSQLPSILQLFSIPEESPQAKSMRGALEECEGETVTGETKICANSLESMLEFVDTIIGSNVKYSILTTSNPSPRTTPLQKYTVLEVSHDIDVPKWVACHPLPYPYAIYYCHYIATKTKVFKVSLVSDENGDKMEALGVCHFDTSEWNPNHIIFKQLGIKAGKNSPVCHFFPVNHLMWIPI